MSILTKEGDSLGQFTELAAQVNQNRRELVSDIPLNVLKSEIHRREQELPFIHLVEQIVLTAESKDVAVSRECLVYELHYDILGRPEMFIGYNISNLTLEQILEEDEKIRKRQLPRRTEDECRIVWSERFVVYDPGKVRPYAGDGNKLQFFIDEFVERVGAETQKNRGILLG